MLHTWLTIFIILTIIMIFVSMYMMEENPIMSIPFIIIGMISSILCTYGVWNVEWAVLHSTDTFTIESAEFGEPYSYVFMLMFFMFFVFMIRAAWNFMKEALETKGEITYSTNKKYFR